MGETVTVRLFVCTQTYDIPCDPRQPAQWLLLQAKNIQRSTRHANNAAGNTSNNNQTIPNPSDDDLEVLYNRTKRMVIDLAEPIGKNISPMDVVDARTLLQTPDATANASALFPWLRSSSKNEKACNNGLFFQQLYAYTLIGRRTPQLPSQRYRQEKQDQYLDLLKTYVCGSFRDELQYEPGAYHMAGFNNGQAAQMRGNGRSSMPPLTPTARSPVASNGQRMQVQQGRQYSPATVFSSSGKDARQPQDRDSDSSSSENTEDSSRRSLNGIAVTDTTAPPKRLHSLSYPPSTPAPASAAPSSHHRRPSASGSDAVLEDMDNVFDIVFKQQAIGMKLGSDETKQFAVVKECFEGSEAKRYPEIQNGVVILAVNGQEVSGLGLSRVLYRLREAPRPVVVRFGRIGRTTHSNSQPQSRRDAPVRSFWGS